MKLAEYCEARGIKPTHPTTEKGAVSCFADEVDHDAWHLSDYVVSSIMAGVIWFVPIKPPRVACPTCGQIIEK